MKRSRNGSGKGGGVAGFGVAPHCMVVVEQRAVRGPPCITGQAGCPLSPLEVVLFFFFVFFFSALQVAGANEVLGRDI